MWPQNKSLDVSLVIPVFNEEENIDLLFAKASKALDEAKLDYEIIFVDDGSRDKTFTHLKNLCENNEKARAISFRSNCGQTPAMVAGIDHAKGKLIITMDGDLQNDPTDIPQLLNKIDEGYDIVVGWRHKRKDRFINRRLPSIIANWLIGKVTGVPIKDNGCSLKAYRAEVIKNTPLYNEMHRFIPAMTSLTGAKVAELKVKHHARQFGQSKYGISRAYKVALDLLTVRTILSLIRHPMWFFGRFGFLFLAGSLLNSLLVLIFMQTGLIVTLVVPMGISVLLFELSIFFFSMGLLTEFIYKLGNINLQEMAMITASISEVSGNKSKKAVSDGYIKHVPYVEEDKEDAIKHVQH